MKILEQGPGWSMEMICTGNGNGGAGCASKLLVEECDLFITGHGYMDGSFDHFVTFRCCNCGTETDVNVPHRIRNVLMKAHRERNGVAWSHLKSFPAN
jgi:hypothetical protein